MEPFDPGLSSVPLELAFQVMTTRYITIGTLTVSWCQLGDFLSNLIQIIIWEMLINICDDYYLLFEHRLRLPTFIYFISR